MPLRWQLLGALQKDVEPRAMRSLDTVQSALPLATSVAWLVALSAVASCELSDAASDAAQKRAGTAFPLELFWVIGPSQGVR